MPIKDMQPRLPQAGRLRLGERTTTKSGKTRPRVLEHFRVTSTSSETVEAVAALYGGEAKAWDNDGRTEYEVIVDTLELPVSVPLMAPDVLSQRYEVWAGGGRLVRHCDGETCTEPVVREDVLSFVEQPCVCDVAARECKPRTRLSVLLDRIEHLGVFRMDTGSVYAVKEIAGAINLMKMFNPDKLVKATLALERRKIKRTGQRARQFRVPVLRPSPAGASAAFASPAAPGRSLPVDTDTGEIFAPPPADQAPLPGSTEPTDSERAIEAQAPPKANGAPAEPSDMAARIERDIAAAADFGQINHVIKELGKARRRLGEEVYGPLYRKALDRAQEIPRPANGGNGGGNGQ